MEEHNKTYKALAVLLFGFDGVSKKVIDVLIKANHLLAYLVEDAAKADVYLVDMDMANVEKLLKGIRPDGKPILVLTVDPSYESTDKEIVLYKPLKSQKLTDCLLEIQSSIYPDNKEMFIELKKESPEISTTDISKSIFKKHFASAIEKPKDKDDRNKFYAQVHVGSHADIDFDDKEQLQKIQFNPENFLFFQLKKAHRNSLINQKLVKLKTVYGVFYIDAKQQKIYHASIKETIKNLHKIPFFKESQMSHVGTSKDLLNDMFGFDYQSFVWESAIKASKGRISNEIDPNDRVRLVHWPDFTKCLIFKHVIRIVSVWSRGQYSLRQTADLLGIQQRYVLTVYAALDALNLVLKETENSKKTKSERGFRFKKIFSKKQR